MAGLNVLIERQKRKTAGESSSKAKGNFCVQQYGTVNFCVQQYGTGNVCVQQYGTVNFCVQQYGTVNFCVQQYGTGNVCVQQYGTVNFCVQQYGTGNFCVQQYGTGNFCVQQYGTGNLLWQWIDETVDVLIKLAIHVFVLLLYVLTEVFAWTVWLWKGKLMGLPPIRTPLYTPSEKGGGLGDLSLEWPPFSSSQVLHVLFFLPHKGCFIPVSVPTVCFVHRVFWWWECAQTDQSNKMWIQLPLPLSVSDSSKCKWTKVTIFRFSIFELLLFAVVKASSDVEEEY